MKVLIADDDLSSCKMLNLILEKLNYEPIITNNGLEAWEVLKQNDPPLLLLIDWEMPKMNGIQLCRRIRTQPMEPAPFIILLTARSDVNDIVEGLEAGANDYIVKPFYIAELKARISVGQRMLKLQKSLKISQNILSYEREVIESVLLKMRASQPFDMQYLRMLDKPVEKISGDILLSAFRGDGIQHILLGDFTGHGITAAIGGPVVFDMFYSMTQKNYHLLDIITHINSQLVKQLPRNLFLGAIFISIDHKRQYISVWNCGMPDILWYREAQLVERLSSNHIALGILDELINPMPMTFDVQLGDKVFGYSDGIIEMLNVFGEEFKQVYLEVALSILLKDQSDMCYLMDQLEAFQGDVKQLDDMTLFELTL